MGVKELAEAVGTDVKALTLGKVDKADIVQDIGSAPDKVMSQYAVTEVIYELSTMSNISYLYDIEQHAAIHALDPETATLPQLIRALQSATLMDYEFEMPPPEP